MRLRKWTDADVTVAAELFDAGLTCEEIGSRFGLTGAAVRYVLRARGFDLVRYPRCTFSYGHGYRQVCLPDGRRELAHRLVVEHAIGRRLAPGEVVHHRDENKLNNAVGNLELLPSISVHMKGHNPGPDGACSRCSSPAVTTWQGVPACYPCFQHLRRYHRGTGCTSSRSCRFAA